MVQLDLRKVLDSNQIGCAKENSSMVRKEYKPTHQRHRLSLDQSPHTSPHHKIPKEILDRTCHGNYPWPTTPIAVIIDCYGGVEEPS